MFLKDLDGNSVDKPAVFALLISRPKTFSAPDVPHSYRQCSHFRYICGIDEPRVRILIGHSESGIFYFYFN